MGRFKHGEPTMPLNTTENQQLDKWLAEKRNDKTIQDMMEAFQIYHTRQCAKIDSKKV